MSEKRLRNLAVCLIAGLLIMPISAIHLAAEEDCGTIMATLYGYTICNTAATEFRCSACSNFAGPAPIPAVYNVTGGANVVLPNHSDYSSAVYYKFDKNVPCTELVHCVPGPQVPNTLCQNFSLPLGCNGGFALSHCDPLTPARQGIFNTTPSYAACGRSN